MIPSITAESLALLHELLADAAPGPVCLHPNGTSAWTGEEYDSSGKSDQSMLLRAARLTRDAVAELELVVGLRNAADSLLAAAELSEKRRERAEQLETAVRRVLSESTCGSGFAAWRALADCLGGDVVEKSP